MSECKGPFVSNEVFHASVKSVMDERRLAQLRTAWLRNVQRIFGYSDEVCLNLYDKIKPYA